MKKQDRQGVRTPADIERKYNLGEVKRTFDDVRHGSYLSHESLDILEKEIRDDFGAELEKYAQKTELDQYAKSADLGNYVAKKDYQSDMANIVHKVAVNTDDVQAVTTDVNDHFEFADGGTRIKGVFNALLLPAGTDLDGVILPNRYMGGSVGDYDYANCPIDYGSFFLCVEACGDQGQLLQRYTYADKTNGKTYERVFDGVEWGNWICVTDYAGVDLNAIQNEVDALGVALGEHMSSFAASIADTDTDVGAVDDKVDALGVRTQTLERSVQAINVDLQAVITDINDHFDFVEGGTAIKGGLMPMVLPSGTDLDGVTIPKKYTSETVANGNYPNSPITSGTFALEVEYCGNQGQVLQRLTYSHKTNGKTFERLLYQGEWGAWVVVTDYTGSALKAVQSEVDTLETALNTYKTESSTRMTKAESNISTISKNVTTVDGKVQNLNAALQTVSADLQGVINDVSDHFEFNEGGMTIKGAINPMLIPAGADLNGLTIPNKYISGVVTEYKYLNCPITSGTFILEVDSCGIEGQLRQRLTYCHKTNSKTYERFSYGVDWGAWLLADDYTAETVVDLRADLEADISALTTKHNTLNTNVNSLSTKINNLFTQTVLWSGQNYMTATQTVNLTEKVSAQRNGIVLVFCEYINGAAATSAFHSFFIPKEQVVMNPGKGYTFTLAAGKFEYMATKYLYIDDQVIEGHADNNTTGTGTSGIKYTNNRFVLRYVIGV